MPESEPENVAVTQQIGQLLFERVEGVRFVNTESLACGGRAVSESVPDFAFFVLFPAKKQRARRLAADQHKNGFGFGKAAEIPEIAVEAVRMMRIAAAKALWRCRNDGDAVADVFEQSGTADGVGCVVHTIFFGERRFSS